MTRANPRTFLIAAAAVASVCGLAAAATIATRGDARAQAPAPAAAAPAPAAALVALPPQPAGVAYPTADGAWPTGAPPAASAAALAAALDQAFASSDGPMGETRAVIVVQGGRIVAERYGPGFDADSRLISWSMAKSVTAAMVGVAVKDGLIALDDPLGDPRWREGDRRATITLRQALQMSDGLRWREDGYDDPLANDAVKMLFGPGRENIVRYAAERSLEHDPGARWRYSSGTTNLISAAVSRRIGADPLRDPTGKEALRSFLYDRLLRPIGMGSAAAEFDIAGNLYASSLMHATARQWAAFGLLHLRDGVWKGERILPEGWVDFVRTPATSEGATHYGAHWWLSTSNGAGLLKRGPFDAFEAHGHEGQVIAVIPSKDLVVVRLGRTTTGEAGWDAIGAWMQSVVDAMPARGA